MRVKLERQDCVPVWEKLWPTERRICAAISLFEDSGVMISVTQLNINMLLLSPSRRPERCAGRPVDIRPRLAAQWQSKHPFRDHTDSRHHILESKAAHIPETELLNHMLNGLCGQLRKLSLFTPRGLNKYVLPLTTGVSLSGMPDGSPVETGICHGKETNAHAFKMHGSVLA